MTTHHEGRIGIRVYGTPVPQGSKVANHFGHGVRDANATRLKPWRETVRLQAEDATRYHDTLTGPVRVWVRFTFARPAAHFRTGRNAHLLRDGAPAYPGKRLGDLDKLQRAILDALTDAKVWGDDTQVVEIKARKFFTGEDELALTRPGVDVIVEPIETTAPVLGGEAGAGAVHQEVLL